MVAVDFFLDVIWFRVKASKVYQLHAAIVWFSVAKFHVNRVKGFTSSLLEFNAGKKSAGRRRSWTAQLVLVLVFLVHLVFHLIFPFTQAATEIQGMDGLLKMAGTGVQVVTTCEVSETPSDPSCSASIPGDELSAVVQELPSLNLGNNEKSLDLVSVDTSPGSASALSSCRVCVLPVFL